ncbi:hypothetical protein BDZ91DRAFT_766823, partial [Kalaharituber pfeilii]
MRNGRPTVTNGRPTVTNGRPTVTNGRPTVTNCRPTVTNGRPTVTNGRPTVIGSSYDEDRDENLIQTSTRQPTVEDVYEEEEDRVRGDSYSYTPPPILEESLRHTIVNQLAREREIIRQDMRELAGRLSQQEIETYTVRSLQEDEVRDLHQRMSKAMEVLHQSFGKAYRKLGGLTEVLRERLPGYPEMEFPEVFAEQGPVLQETNEDNEETKSAVPMREQITKKRKIEEGGPSRPKERETAKEKKVGAKEAPQRQESSPTQGSKRPEEKEEQKKRGDKGGDRSKTEKEGEGDTYSGKEKNGPTTN